MEGRYLYISDIMNMNRPLHFIRSPFAKGLYDKNSSQIDRFSFSFLSVFAGFSEFHALYYTCLEVLALNNGRRYLQLQPVIFTILDIIFHVSEISVFVDAKITRKYRIVTSRFGFFGTEIIYGQIGSFTVLQLVTY